LADYAKAFGYGERIEGADETSLIQAIAHLNPVVIIDESHNFEAKLRVEMFQQINPSFILDLTATPREKSNIISFVDAKDTYTRGHSKRVAMYAKEICLHMFEDNQGSRFATAMDISNASRGQAMRMYQLKW